MKVFDYVVVGAGSAGCALANRLTEDRQTTVLLLEAGGWDTSPFMHVPVGLLQIRAKHSWQYVGEHDPSRPTSDQTWKGGKVLGGSSSVNGQVWTRGAPADFDAWAELGCKGWDYESVLPYFKRIETFSGGGDAYRGDRGPLRVSYAALQHPLTDAFVEAAQEAGHPFNRDFNGARQDGVSYSQVSQRRGLRHSTARAYLGAASLRRNLTIATRCLATRILFADQRATGVEYRTKNGARARASARREIIVSAGAIESPKLLQLSGIGARDHLEALGIGVVHDNPAVGGNLQEHAGISLRFRVTVPTLNMQLDVAGIVRNGIDFLARGRGAATSPPTHAFVFGKVADDHQLQDYELFFGPFGMGPTPNPRGPERVLGAVSPTKEPVVFVGVAACHPESRGTVMVRTAAPDDPPVITHQLLTASEIAVLTYAGRKAREIMAAPAFRQYVAAELTPGPGVDTDEEWEAFIHAAGRGGHHPIGTCKMGTDPNAVVDPQLVVNGVEGLRVADASIMPTLVSGHTNAAAVMIGERAADLVRDA